MIAKHRVRIFLTALGCALAGTALALEPTAQVVEFRNAALAQVAQRSGI